MRCMMRMRSVRFKEYARDYWNTESILIEYYVRHSISENTKISYKFQRRDTLTEKPEKKVDQKVHWRSP